MTGRDFPQARALMVSGEVKAKGIDDPQVLAAMGKVPRHFFVPEPLWREAYGASALPIGHKQTISAPQMVGLMSQALKLERGQKVLEVGTGSGYQAAVLATITGRVITIERVPELARAAQKRFQELGLDLVVKVGDGSLGYAAAAPYDRIVVTAAAPAVPPALLDQLTPDGILVAPVGDRREQTLMRYTRDGDRIREEALCRCVFVPLLGREGFSVEDAG